MRANWLLIKHRDASAHEVKKNAILSEDVSVASGRSVDDIAAGKGRGPIAFITGVRSRASAKAKSSSQKSASSASFSKRRSRTVAALSKPTSRKKVVGRKA
jgi:bifunctional non-homologous end joining protein LigD